MPYATAIVAFQDDLRRYLEQVQVPRAPSSCFNPDLVLLGAADLNELVGSADRNEKLKALHQRAIIELNGH